MILNHIILQNVRPKNKRYELKDGKGLYLRVMPSGSMSWVYVYKFEGTLRRMTLGSYPAMGLSDARLKHSEAVNMVKNGSDPGRKKQEAKQALKGEPTFSDFLEEYWDTYLIKRKAGDGTLRLIKKDALPAWRLRRLDGITRRDVVRLHDKVSKRAKVGANRLIGALSKMFNHAIRRGVLEHNPCLMVERSEEKPRDRVLTDAEIQALWLALDLDNKKIDLFRSTKLALRLILLTGCRGGEVAGAMWEEIQAGVWHIPGERTKNGDPLDIPITPLIQDTLNQAAALAGDGPFVFASSHLVGGPITRHSLSVATHRHWKEFGCEKKFVPHDIRRTVRTKLAEIGIDDHIAERMMGHRLQGMMKIYNKHPYLDEKRAALLRLESHLKKLAGLADASDAGKVIQVNFR